MNQIKLFAWIVVAWAILISYMQGVMDFHLWVDYGPLKSFGFIICVALYSTIVVIANQKYDR